MLPKLKPKPVTRESVTVIDWFALVNVKPSSQRQTVKSTLSRQVSVKTVKREFRVNQKRQARAAASFCWSHQETRANRQAAGSAASLCCLPRSLRRMQ